MTYNDLTVLFQDDFTTRMQNSIGDAIKAKVKTMETRAFPVCVTVPVLSRDYGRISDIKQILKGNGFNNVTVSQEKHGDLYSYTIQINKNGD